MRRAGAGVVVNVGFPSAAGRYLARNSAGHNNSDKVGVARDPVQLILGIQDDIGDSINSTSKSLYFFTAVVHFCTALLTCLNDEIHNHNLLIPVLHDLMKTRSEETMGTSSCFLIFLLTPL